MATPDKLSKEVNNELMTDDNQTMQPIKLLVDAAE